MFVYFLEIIQLLHISFFTDLFGITQRVTSLKRPFYSISSSAGSHLEVFWGSFWVVLFHSWEAFHILFYEILYRCILYYSDSQCAKKNFTASIPLLLALCSMFGCIFQCLENLKYFLDVLHGCSDITISSSALDFWVFLVHFVLCSSNSREPYNIFTWTFFFEIRCKLIYIDLQSCNNVHYWVSLLIDKNKNRSDFMDLLRYVNISVTAIAHKTEITIRIANRNYHPTTTNNEAVNKIIKKIHKENLKSDSHPPKILKTL